MVTDAKLPLAADDDTRRWSSSILVGVGFAAVALFYSFLLAGWIYHTRFWMTPGDTWMTVDGGRYIWAGAFGYVYQGTSSYALPLSFIVMAPISGLMDHLHLVEGSPYPVAKPSAWLLVGPYTLLYGIFLLHAVRRLAWQLGLRSRLWVVQSISAAVVLAPAYFWGHFEDMLALTFVIHAVRLVLKQDPIRAALMVSIAVSFKQWALMLIPMMVFAAPVGKRLRTLVAGCALPGMFVLFFLGVDWPDASRAFFSPVNLVGHFQGHASFYATWLGKKTSQLSRTLGLVGTVPLGWWLRRARRPEAVLAAMAVLVLVRPFSEAINYSYYWSPFLLLAGAVGVAVHRKFRWQDWIWQVGVIAWASPRANSATMGWWWAGEMILLSATAVQMLRNCGVRFAPADRLLISVKTSLRKPISNAMNLAPAAGDRSWTQ